MKLGIIPAAGLASRWGHYPKFLLPCGDKEWLLDRAIRSIPFRSIVVYSDDTYAELFRHIERQGLSSRVTLTKQLVQKDIFGAMMAAMEFEAEYYYFYMPDTYPDTTVFAEFPMEGISLGLHRTVYPERFGMLRDNRIVNKKEGASGLAWGLLGWSKAVRDLWMHAHLETYTEAINLALQEEPVHMGVMDYYYDMATFDDYRSFLHAKEIFRLP